MKNRKVKKHKKKLDKFNKLLIESLNSKNKLISDKIIDKSIIVKQFNLLLIEQNKLKYNNNKMKHQIKILNSHILYPNLLNGCFFDRIYNMSEKIELLIKEDKKINKNIFNLVKFEFIDEYCNVHIINHALFNNKIITIIFKKDIELKSDGLNYITISDENKIIKIDEYSITKIK